MNEKRFITIDHSTCVFDKITKEEYVCIDREEAFLVCKRLNEQQATINKLKKARDESDKFIAKKGLGAEFLEWCVENE